MVICEYATHGIIFTATNIVHKLIQNIIRYIILNPNREVITDAQ